MQIGKLISLKTLSPTPELFYALELRASLHVSRYFIHRYCFICFYTYTTESTESIPDFRGHTKKNPFEAIGRLKWIKNTSFQKYLDMCKQGLNSTFDNYIVSLISFFPPFVSLDGVLKLSSLLHLYSGGFVICLYVNKSNFGISYCFYFVVS